MPITSTGLVSGINFDSIISQIQDSERGPILQLQGRQTGYQNQISGLLALSSKLSAFAAVAASVNDPANFNTRTASVTKTTAGVSLLSATTDTTATNGSYNINVLQLAQAQKLAARDLSTRTPRRSQPVRGPSNSRWEARGQCTA